ncbi:alpha/beta hydrolase [Brachybacterium horti]
MIRDPVFGAGYTARRIDLGEDAEGPLIATLVHREQEDAPQERRRPPVLALHGWSDYVLDRDLLDHLGASGHDVWGLDLRKHGRSLLPGQTPTAIDHLSRYDRELDAALRIIGTPPVLLAHSTGGLVAALYAQRRPGAVAALALNSPWLEMHLGRAARALLGAPIAALAARRGDLPVLPPGPSHYVRTVHRDYGGEYHYDLALKPPGGHRFPTSTFAAVLDGQHRLAAAGPLTVPVLVLHSERSRLGFRFQESMRRADVVLDVRAIASAGRRLGPSVRVVALPGARHDVFLSEESVRRAAIDVLDGWLEELPAPPDGPTMGRQQSPGGTAGGPRTASSGGAPSDGL